jgi:hypothetical protein
LFAKVVCDRVDIESTIVEYSANIKTIIGDDTLSAGGGPGGYVVGPVDSGGEVVDGKREGEGTPVVFGTEVEGDTSAGLTDVEEVAHIEDEALVGVVGDKGGRLDLVVDGGGDGVEVGVGVEDNLGVVGLYVGDTVKEFGT